MKLTHHAYYLEGPPTVVSELTLSLKKEGEVIARTYERFGIDDAHALQYQAALKSGQRQLFVIATSSITTEAQQALLKLFEEPQGSVTFVLIVPHGSLLPTLRSRCLPFPESISVVRPNSASAAHAFLKASGKERSDIIGALLKDEDNVRESARELIVGLEQLLDHEFAKTKEKKEMIAGLEELHTMQRYLGDRSASLKMILEHLAAALPQHS